MSKAPAIGIDLGTTYSCVAVFQNNTVNVIPNEQGSMTTPSIVGFTEDDGCVVGEAARAQMSENPENTVYDAKRLIGRRWDDSVVQKDMEKWPFKVLQEKGGQPTIEVEYQGEMKTFLPEQISARVLTKLKECAEEYLGKKVEDAVITVPAYFTNAQRESTRNAATIAGLNVLSIINEPTAAAIAYGFEKNITGGRTVLVYDLGGGTFDVSLLKIVGNDFEVLATGGHSHLGGMDFDNNMVDYFVKEILKKDRKDISKLKRSLSKLRERCEMAKRHISSPGQARSTVIVDSLYDGKAFRGVITKGHFNEMNANLFSSTMGPLRQVLQDAKMSTRDIDDVVLAGGSTRIPQIRALLDEFFDNKPIAAINPDEIVAKGAAIRAAAHNSSRSNMARLKNFKLTDVNSLSLGIKITGDRMSVLIERNTKLPASKQNEFTNSAHWQKNVNIVVFEGESADVTNNSKVDEFILDIEPQPKGAPKIDVTFHLNTEGILKVTAKDRTSGRENSITKTLEKLSEQDISRLLREAERFKEEDRKFKENAEAKVELDRFAYDATYRAENSTKLNAVDRRTVVSKCDDAIEWIANNKLAPKHQFETKLQELKRVCEPLLKKA